MLAGSKPAITHVCLGPGHALALPAPPPGGGSPATYSAGTYAVSHGMIVHGEQRKMDKPRAVAGRGK
jgi:hypothetical protein